MEVVAVKYQTKCAQTKISDSKNPLFNKSNEHVQVMKKKYQLFFICHCTSTITKKLSDALYVTYLI